MPAYALFIRETPVRDADSYAAYSASNRAHAARFMGDFGMKPLSVYAAMQVLEGDAPDGVILIEFPNMDAAMQWYNSAEYQSVIALRQAAADWRVFFFEGMG